MTSVNQNAVMDMDSELTDANGTRQFLTFILAEEEYGLDILRVQEIKGWDDVTPIPNTPDYIKGVINLRGIVIPIVDLRIRFGLPVKEFGPTTVVVVLKIKSSDNERTMGIVVDAVSEVYTVKADQIKPAPDFGGDVDLRYVRGLVSLEESMVIILDIDHLLASSEIKTLAKLGAADSGQ